MGHRTSQRDVTLVTDAQRPKSEDIAFRERRYLAMMGIRVGCFVLAVVLFAAHAGWLAAIPAAGAIVIPYFAVVFANGGREPSSTKGLRHYEPNLPEQYSRPSDPSSRSATGSSFTTSGSDGVPGGHRDSPDDYGTH
jgi:Protein of unknown function (DUF3099)